MKPGLIFVMAFLVSPLFAAEWKCTYDSHRATVSLDPATRLLRVASRDGVTDEGFAVKRTYEGTDTVEYTMGYNNIDYAYYLRISGREGGPVELRYCAGCAPYLCEAKSSGR